MTFTKTRSPEYQAKDGFKRCVQCEEVKPVDQYFTFPTKGGRKPTGKCKFCSHGLKLVQKSKRPEYRPTADGTKRCTICEAVKPLADFPFYQTDAGPRPEGKCKSCGVRMGVEWARRNPEKRAAISARFQSSAKGKANAAKCWRKMQADVGRHAANLEYRRRWYQARYATDAQYAMSRRLSARLGSIVKSQGAKKADATMRLVGCTWAFLTEHIERQFADGMGWHNRAEWHIDHIRPLCSFDFTKAEDQRDACHWTNLQPLWAADNMAKSDLMPDGTRGRRMRYREEASSGDEAEEQGQGTKA